MRPALPISTAAALLLMGSGSWAGPLPSDANSWPAAAVQLAQQSGTEGTTAMPNVTDEQVDEAGRTSTAYPSVVSGSNVRGPNAPHPLFTDEEQEEISKRPPLQSPKDKALPMQATFYFEFDKANLTKSAEQKARELAAEIRQQSAVKVVVDGHTDTVGSEPYNKELSDERAHAVKQALVKHGVPDYQIITHAFGESDPRVPTGDEVKLQENRRVKVKVVQ